MMRRRVHELRLREMGGRGGVALSRCFARYGVWSCDCWLMILSHVIFFLFLFFYLRVRVRLNLTSLTSLSHRTRQNRHS